MGMKFGTDEETFRPLLRAKFHPMVATIRVQAPKTEILLIFDQNVEYKCRAGASLARFSQKLQSLYPVSGCVSCSNFVGLAHSSRGYGVTGVLSWRALVIPKFSVPLAAKLCVKPQTFWRCKNVLEVLYHRAKFGGARISKTLILFVCLSVSLYVCPSRFWTSEFACPISPWRRCIVPERCWCRWIEEGL